MKRSFAAILLVCCLLPGGFLVGQPSRSSDEQKWDSWTPGLQMRFASISGVTVSPDGKYIAYVVRKPIMDGEKSEYRTQVWVAAADGSSNVPYTMWEHSAGSPSFSPDSKSLAFTSSREDKKSQLWIMRVAGGEAEKITETKNGVNSFAWSPDGSMIAYTMTDPPSEEEEKEKKEKRDVILVDKNFHYSHLYTVSVAKDDLGKRTTKRLTAGGFHVTSFDWSPDGKTIAFAHQPTPLINDGFMEKDISVVPSDSGAVRDLVKQPGVDDNPLYSPDGKWIAFSSDGGTPEPIGLADIFLVSASGGTPKKLADTHDRAAQLLAWSSDNSGVFYSEVDGTSIRVFFLPADGKAPRMITSGEGVFSSASFDRKTDVMAFTYQNADTPVELYTSPVHSFRMTLRSSVNADVPKPAMGRTELLTWSSKDGRRIEGLLTYPVNYRKGQRYPLILNVHGGPAGAFTQSFTGNPGIYMIQTFAQHGYAVLRPNPRGSTGYGKDFRFANFKDWGYGDFDDLMTGVDKVIAMGVGDKDSLCLMGWSYGGYMTSFAVTRTTRFKAASMGAGLPNLISMVTTTDISDYLVAHMGSEYWKDYATYEKHSAVYHIANVKTPTQVFHGQNDVRVPFTQGQEFYVSLKRLGVPTEMIVYPRTPHGPREPKFVKDVTPRILRWFDKYLRKK